MESIFLEDKRQELVLHGNRRHALVLCSADSLWLSAVYADADLVFFVVLNLSAYEIVPAVVIRL
jgi:hypothetical protein